MCLAVPGKVVAWLLRDPPFAKASVQFGGVRREVWMYCVAEAEPDDYVLVHAGVAICRISPEEAQRTLATLDELAWRESGLLSDDGLDTQS